MSYSTNPHYYPEKLGLKQLTFDEPNMSYEYNTLAFWATPDGQIYTAHDSGCSCPTPFEDLESDTLEAFKKKAERVGSLRQAEEAFNSWNKQTNYKGETSTHLPTIDSLRELEEFFNFNFKES